MSALSRKLGQLLAKSPVSIELLPGDGSEWLAEDMPEESNPHAPFLLMEGNLGVPRKLAYKAYLESVPAFRRSRTVLHAYLRVTPATGPSLDLVSAEDVADILDSSSVLLLVNPAHQSALNARKGLLTLGALDATRELRFASSLLTLHEGAKQSVLWHHRRWLLRRIYSLVSSSCGETPSRSSDIPGSLAGDGEDSLCGLGLDSDVLSTEFAIVQRACEIYPRNYHAWAHRYLCAEALATALRGDTGPGLMDAWQQERDRIRQWIERHVSDYSAMQYACHLEDLDRGLAASGEPITAVPAGHTQEKIPEERESVVEHAWTLVQAYPSHKSLWLYLRGALRPQFSPAALRLGSATSDRVRDGARALAERFLSDGSADHGGSVSPGEHALVRRHAARFLAWLSWQEGKLKLHGREGAVREIMAGGGEPRQGDAPYSFVSSV
ncbi:Protein prenyltransferase alpha subunit repeat-containing protein 1 [Trametes pubescens]|uniref:Protein prenyltransferase alpha subunit repeat-containing protein 1 n=1 Tax=Trametes pubescens TaxID=154538 RepID=A0A1M2V2Y5_TRAPU|nr:Protein prenyltransferase alpha subunit repeat-containing protein 1 [Trametes pubescens]